MRLQKIAQLLAQSMPRDFTDPYADPISGVLHNKPGLRDDASLKEFEYEHTAGRLRELAQTPIEGKFDMAHLKAIHGYVFQDVYDWAGQARVVNISKGGSAFTHPGYLDSHGAKIAAALESENFLKGLDKPAFVDRLAHHYAELNALHPFREGNGRVTREFLGQLARGAGYELDQTKIDNTKEQWNLAAKASVRGDLGPIKQVFTEAVRYSRAVAFEKLPEAEALGKHPELKGAFDGLKVMASAIAERFPGNDKAQALYGVQARSEVLRKLDSGQVLASPLDRFQVRESSVGYRSVPGSAAGYQVGGQVAARAQGVER